MPRPRFLLAPATVAWGCPAGCPAGRDRGGGSPSGSGTRPTIATINGADMIVMRRLSREFEDQTPGVTPDWVVLEANVLRERTMTDVSAGGPVRHPHSRRVRDADLGRARLAGADG